MAFRFARSAVFTCILGLIVDSTAWTQAPAAGSKASGSNLDALRAAATNGGDPIRGKAVFSDARGRCNVCHSVDGSGGKVGPDLFGIADKLERAGLIKAVLEPSADILPGFEATVVRTADGKTQTGVLRFANDRHIEIVGADGKASRIARTEVEEMQVSRQSLMPEGMERQWTQQEFADLVAYLGTLHLPQPTTANRPDNPAKIAVATRPLQLIPFVGRGVGLQRPVWFGPLRGLEKNYLAVEVERAQVWRIDAAGGDVRKSMFVDLSRETRHGYIEGILGFAIHPDFAKNRRYFVAMHDPARDRIVVDVWERQAAADGLRDSGSPGRKLLSSPMPHVNHNGCCLEFGPDGCLYISFGDGGPQEDPNGYSQSLG